MISRTKYAADDNTVKKLFAAAGIDGVSDIRPLGAGEFNTVLSAEAGGKKYALKIAPSPDTEVLEYENNMMSAEVLWYKRMRENTSINVPEIYFSDFSRKIIPSDYFIMEKLEGAQSDKLKMSDAEKRGLTAEMARMTAEMHRVKNDKFGYVQWEFYDDWYQTVRSMVSSLIESCEKKGHKSPRGEKLLRYIDKYKSVLEKAECSMVNYDIWPMNIIAKRDSGKIKYWWIDPERCFWGDKMADFVCLEVYKPLKDKTASLNAYNAVAETPIEVNRETEIRYAVMAAYMGLLQEAEKYYRYTPAMFGWWRNVIGGAALFYKIGFGILKNG